jgi:hypothetical protein
LVTRDHLLVMIAMIMLTERIEERAAGPALKTSGVPVAEVLALLERGAGRFEPVLALGLEALDVVAAIAYDVLGEGPGCRPPALVQESPRRPALQAKCEEAALSGLFPSATRTARLCLSAGLLQIRDFWDASHHAAQAADDLGERSVSAYWHGIAHRREPDPGNAAYWFRRVGRHPLFNSLAEAALSVLEATDQSVSDRLLPRGTWDPFAFIDFTANLRPELAPVALELQRLEMRLLLAASIPTGFLS